MMLSEKYLHQRKIFAFSFSLVGFSLSQQFLGGKESEELICIVFIYNYKVYGLTAKEQDSITFLVRKVWFQYLKSFPS